jgi:hypothetical protein
MTQGIRYLSLLRREARHEDAATALEEEAFDDRLVEAVGQRPAHGRIATAVVESIAPDGIARVVLSGEAVPREASSVVRFSSAGAASEALVGRTVLVLQDPLARPVILGPVCDRLWEEPAPGAPVEVRARLPIEEPLSVQLDKRRLNLEASEEIRLTCGKSFLLLRRDGTVIVRGVKVVSRASQANKIRGATVEIN